MSEGGGRSGLSPWLIGAAAVLWFRRTRGRADEVQRREHGTDRFMRHVVTEDGEAALQVEVVLYEPGPGSSEQWEHVRVEGSEREQEHLRRVLRASDGPDDGPTAVVAVLVPFGTRRRVNAIDCHLAGGAVGHLPRPAVARWGAALRAVQVERGGQPSAVLARVVQEHTADGRPRLALEVLMPETFGPG